MSNNVINEKLFDVLVVGELNVDLILNHLEKFPVIGKEVLAHKMILTLGSSSAIFASNLSTLGSRVAFSGRLGIDDFGDLITTTLDAKGVDTSAIQRSSSVSTGATIVLNFGEDRAMVTHQGAMEDFSMADIPDNILRQSKHLHVSSIFLQTALKKDIVRLYMKAKALGLTTSLDPQWDPAEKWDLDFKNLLPYVDVFLPNAKELECITNIRDIKAAAQSLSIENILVVKNGSAGACLWDGKEFINQSSFLNINVVDSIGAGDSFDAGFIHKFIQQRPLQECLEFATLMGAVSTTRAGGTTAFENINTVKKIAETSFNYTF
jgi:sugar/nucleoside kinase (ribokinase family)